MRQSLMSLLFASLALFDGSAGAEEIRLTNGEWSPYLGQQLPYNGVASRIVSEAFALEGVQVQWEFLPWARALHLAEQGQRAGTAVWLRSPDRDAQFFVSEAVVSSGYSLFHRKGEALDWTRAADLKSLRIGGTNGYDYGEEFERAEQSGELQVTRLSSEEQGLRMLLANRLDVFPIDPIVAMDLLHSRFSAAERARLSYDPKPLRSDSLHLLLSRKVPGNDALMARFNHGLNTLRANGRIAQYLLEIQQPLSMSQ
ncbi:transporter substrate-binding domain-containing protein [Pseudomonas sp.]|uniref:substrate-binding periplasmic protein n=1 Tax=Pseudomonas sp. TaxID=306 RepID=UPI0028B16B54|nr:transporter substrate-binding domain-containing protein [Pseudomonas sp.]